MAVNFPALAHRVTVFGSTLKSAATSAGVNKISWSLEFRSMKHTPNLAKANLELSD
jgi:hypothetical protein